MTKNIGNIWRRLLELMEFISRTDSLIIDKDVGGWEGHAIKVSHGKDRGSMVLGGDTGCLSSIR
jgi:hypothetical protein